MYESLDQCPVCKFTDFENALITSDHHLTQESFALVRCKRCQHLFTNPRPNEKGIAPYYQSPDYISHTSKSQGIISPLYRLARKFNLQSKTKLIKKFHNQGSLLDYGCGTGNFLHHVNQLKGWHTRGIEPSVTARSSAQSLGLTVDEDLTADNQDKFDVITAWHVIEHVHQLRATIQGLRKRMHDKSVFLMALPNPHSYDAIYYGKHWAGYDVPRHLHHFTESSISRLLSESKLKLIETVPMTLDAYYVSILSEKYQKSSFGFVKGLKTGFISNHKARKTHQYSSLIHIISK